MAVETEIQLWSFGLPDTPGYSRYFIEGILKSKVLDSRQLKNLNDFKLLQLGWIFDINFQPTIEIIYKNRYMDKIIDALPKNRDMEKVRKHVNSYIEKRVGGGSSE